MCKEKTTTLTEEYPKENERQTRTKNELLQAIKFHSGEDHALMGLRKLVALATAIKGDRGAKP